MRFLDAKSIGMLGLVLALGMSNAGCGDDDDSAGDAGPDGSVDGGAGMNGGSGGTKGGSGGTKGGMDSGTTTGGTGGRTTGGTGGATIPAGMCDTSIPSTAKCGGTMCPGASGMGAAFTCTVPCCLPDDSCGLRRAYMDDPTDCAKPGVADNSCPEYMGQGPFGGMTLPMMDAGADAGDSGANMYTPCCASSGHCGIISSIDMLCITKSPILTDLMPGPACGEGNDGGTDAGN